MEHTAAGSSDLGRPLDTGAPMNDAPAAAPPELAVAGDPAGAPQEKAAALPPKLAVVWGVAEETRHQLRRLLRQRGFGFTRNPRLPGVALQWTSVRDVEWDPVLEGRCLANHAIARPGLVRKAELASCLLRRRRDEGGGGGAAVMPETWLWTDVVGDGFAKGDAVPHAAAQSGLAERLRGGGAWVLKASESSCGARVLPFRAGEDGELPAGTAVALEEWCAEGRPWLVQRYVAPPLLWRGRKTHLRAYVLVVGAPAAENVWVNELVMVMSATSAWTDTEMEDSAAHVTNNCAQPAPDGDGTAPPTNCTLQEFCAEAFAAAGGAAQHASMRADVARAVSRAFDAVSRSSKSYFATQSCFELFGVDLMFDDQLRCWLLEVNSMPGLEILGDDRRERMLSDVLDKVLPTEEQDEAEEKAEPAAGHVNSFRLATVWAAEGGGGGGRLERLPYMYLLLSLLPELGLLLHVPLAGRVGHISARLAVPQLQDDLRDAGLLAPGHVAQFVDASCDPLVLRQRRQHFFPVDELPQQRRAHRRCQRLACHRLAFCRRLWRPIVVLCEALLRRLVVVASVVHVHLKLLRREAAHVQRVPEVLRAQGVHVAVLARNDARRVRVALVEQCAQPEEAAPLDAVVVVVELHALRHDLHLPVPEDVDLRRAPLRRA